MEKETPNHRTLLPIEGAHRLFFLENWDPGWQATVNDQTNLPVERSSDGTMYVDLPTGLSIAKAEFRYFPVWRMRGAGITLISALVFVALTVLSYRKRPNLLDK